MKPKKGKKFWKRRRWNRLKSNRYLYIEKDTKIIPNRNKEDVHLFLTPIVLKSVSCSHNSQWLWHKGLEPTGKKSSEKKKLKLKLTNRPQWSFLQRLCNGGLFNKIVIFFLSWILHSKSSILVIWMYFIFTMSSVNTRRNTNGEGCSHYINFIKFLMWKFFFVKLQIPREVWINSAS